MFFQLSSPSQQGGRSGRAATGFCAAGWVCSTAEAF